MVTICFNIAEYFGFWLNSEYEPAIKFTNNGRHQLQLDDLLSLGDGLYKNSLLGNEGHDWFWLIQGEIVMYAGGYGGETNIEVKEFDRKIYLEAFYRAMNGDLVDYGHVFQVRPQISEVGFQWITISKSSTYGI